MIIILLSLTHLAVDGACASVLFLSAGVDAFSVAAIYNTVAFSTQALTGLLTDRLGRCKLIIVSSCALISVFCFMPTGPILRAIAVGCGNSFFHVAAGSIVLRKSSGKAGSLGAFVAPGCIGVSLGSLFPALRPVFAVALLILSAMILLIPDDDGFTPPLRPDGNSKGTVYVVLLCLIAVSVRSIGSSCVSTPWAATPLLSLALTACIFGGKLLGGFIVDRLGAKKSALISLPLASVLVPFLSSSIALSMAGQFLLNLTMPLTLYLVFLVLPENPGFAFGLAASVLWPGALAGRLIRQMNCSSVFVFLCFAVGFAALMISIILYRRIEK